MKRRGKVKRVQDLDSDFVAKLSATTFLIMLIRQSSRSHHFKKSVRTENLRGVKTFKGHLVRRSGFRASFAAWQLLYHLSSTVVVFPKVQSRFPPPPPKVGYVFQLCLGFPTSRKLEALKNFLELLTSSQSRLTSPLFVQPVQGKAPQLSNSSKAQNCRHSISGKLCTLSKVD